MLQRRPQRKTVETLLQLVQQPIVLSFTDNDRFLNLRITHRTSAIAPLSRLLQPPISSPTQRRRCSAI
jgi:hypothetical protein